MARLRSIMSAAAPAGTVNKKKGNAAIVETSESSREEAPKWLSVQATAKSCAETQQPEATAAAHTHRKTGFRNGCQTSGERLGAEGAVLVGAGFMRDLTS
jgi:hypothetical protein